jgi:hypothetical protein
MKGVDRIEHRPGFLVIFKVHAHPFRLTDLIQPHSPSRSCANTACRAASFGWNKTGHHAKVLSDGWSIYAERPILYRCGKASRPRRPKSRPGSHRNARVLSEWAALTVIDKAPNCWRFCPQIRQSAADLASQGLLLSEKTDCLHTDFAQPPCSRAVRPLADDLVVMFFPC